MKGKFIVLIIAVLVFLAGFFAYQWLFPDSAFSRTWNKLGELHVDAKPKVSVFVDNNLVGQTPLQVSLSEGVHTVKLVPEAKQGTSLQTWTERVKIYKRTTTYIMRVLGQTSEESAGEVIVVERSGDSEKGEILINTRPSGLFVRLNGEERGVSPLLIGDLPETEHEITVTGEGLMPRSIPVRTKDGYKLLIDVSLAVDRAYKERKQKEKPKTSEALLQIADTPTGWLRVRYEPSLDASEAARLDSGTVIKKVGQKDGWFEVEYKDGKGWVNGEYVREVTPTPVVKETSG